jgi:predicted anti-sigma-YlaC factor YlaD
MMTCQTIEVLLSAYADGEVTPTEQQLVESHLHECTACQATLQRWTGIRTLFHSLEQQTAPRDFRQHVTARIDAAARRAWAWFRWPRWVLATLCVGMIFTGGLLAGLYVARQSTPIQIAANEPEIAVYAEDVLFTTTDEFSTEQIGTLGGNGIAEEMLDTLDFSDEDTSSNSSWIPRAIVRIAA